MSLSEVIEKGIARGIFLAVFESETEAMRAGHGISERVRVELASILYQVSEYGYDDAAPATPAWAFVAGDALYEAIETVNDKPMLTILSEAEVADRRARRTNMLIVAPPEITEEDYAHDFGLALGQMVTGDEGAWFDGDHGDFALKLPRDFDFYSYFDGDLGPKLTPQARKSCRRRGASGQRAR